LPMPLSEYQIANYYRYKQPLIESIVRNQKAVGEKGMAITDYRSFRSNRGHFCVNHCDLTRLQQHHAPQGISYRGIAK
jgi:hypothetical protein